ncbi:MAG: hypothetical protein SOW25_02305 [Helicobacter sp.]|nr:hypothetical protein [Helicobacter sp.]
MVNGIVTLLKTKTPSEIEAFCANRFNANLSFFENSYPNLFKALQTPAKEFQLYINENGVNIFNFKQNYMLFPLDEFGKSTMLEIHENCAFNPPINEKWDRIYGSKASFMEENFSFSSILVDGILNYSANNGGVSAYHLPSGFLPSLSLYGLGGGIFLQILAENYEKIHNFFIFEESFDLFRISCFFVDFPLLFSKTEDKAGYIFLESLMGRNYIEHFFATRKISNSVVRFECMFYNSEKNISARSLVREMHGQILRGWGTFED